MVSVNIRDSAVLRVAQGVARVRLGRLGREVEATAIGLCNVGATGRLRSSFEVEFFDRPVFPSVSVRNTAPYAKFVHNGTFPHPIIGKPLLVFAGTFGTVRTTLVHHPGYRGNPFLREALFRSVGR